jgi:exodeoxyribonuclease VII large subunit
MMVDRARDALRRAVRHRLDREQAQLDVLRSRPALAHPGTLLDARIDELDGWRARIRRQLEWQLDRAADDLDHRRARVRALSPLATLRRGYAVLQDADGHVVTSVGDVSADAALSVRVADGRIHVTATTTEEIHD